MTKKRYAIFASLLFLALLMKNIGGIGDLRHIWPFPYEKLGKLNAGEKTLFPESIVELVNQMRAMQIHDFTFAPPVDGHIQMQIISDAYPIVPAENSKHVLFNEAAQKGLLFRGCKIMFVTHDKELGVANCRLLPNGI